MHSDVPETQTVDRRFVQGFVNHRVPGIQLFLRKFKPVFSLDVKSIFQVFKTSLPAHIRKPSEL